MKQKPTEIQKSNRKKVVLDTSVLLLAILTDGAYRKLLRKTLAADFELCIPQEVIDEVDALLDQPKFKKYEPYSTEILEELRKSALLLPYPEQIIYKLEGSKEDEGIINCCALNKVDYLLTHDRKTEGSYNGLTVIFAQEFYHSFLED